MLVINSYDIKTGAKQRLSRCQDIEDARAKLEQIRLSFVNVGVATYTNDKSVDEFSTDNSIYKNEEE